jgi:hypothetical protein
MSWVLYGPDSAAIAWCMVALIAASFPNWRLSLAIATFSAVGLTTLWGAHLLALGQKVVSTLGSNKPLTPTPLRRDVVFIFTRAVAAAATVSAPPMVALAQPKCTAQDGKTCADSQDECGKSCRTREKEAPSLNIYLTGCCNNWVICLALHGCSTQNISCG